MPKAETHPTPTRENPCSELPMTGGRWNAVMDGSGSYEDLLHEIETQVFYLNGGFELLRQQICKMQDQVSPALIEFEDEVKFILGGMRAALDKLEELQNGGPRERFALPAEARS